MRIGKAFKGKFAAINTTLAGKTNTNFSNAEKPYVIAAWGNGISWYRKWSNGFIEQGGVVSNTGASYVLLTQNLLIAFTTTSYSVFLQGRLDSASAAAPVVGLQQTATTFKYFWSSNTNNMFWYACGY